jgi:LuxR family transcriptional regulator, maltose regulon positive regulatory protein
MHHALAGTEFDLAADWIEQHADALIKRGEHHTLAGWLARLPQTVLDTRPPLLLIHATVRVMLHDLERAERDLDTAQNNVAAAEPQVRQGMKGEIAALRALIASLQDDLPRAVRLAQEALVALPPTDVRRRAEVMYRLGVAHAWQGEVAAATAVYLETKRLSLEANDLHTALLAMINLAAMQSMQGNFPQALALNQQTLAWATEQGVQQMPILGMVHAELARICYEFDQLDQAMTHSEAAIQAGERGGLPRLRADGHILRVMVLIAQRDLVGAQAEMDKAERLIEQYELPLRYRGFALRLKLHLSLATGDLTAAEQWAQHSGRTTSETLDYPHEEERLALAHWLVAQGHYAEANAFLERLRQFAEARHHLNQVIRMLALQAKTLALLGDRAQALTTLERGLTLAAPLGYVRTFVDQGQAMQVLFLEFRFWLARRAPASLGAPLLAYVAGVLAAFPNDEASRVEWPIQPAQSSAQPSSDLLSSREIEVLHLVGAGASNQEIAEQLIISLNTVKRHIHNVFNKLGVDSRTQAVAQARTLGLL